MGSSCRFSTRVRTPRLYQTWELVNTFDEPHHHHWGRRFQVTFRPLGKWAHVPRWMTHSATEGVDWRVNTGVHPSTKPLLIKGKYQMTGKLQTSFPSSRKGTETDQRAIDHFLSLPLLAKPRSIVWSSIHRHLEAHRIFTDAQHRFRRRQSCETQLIITNQDQAKTSDCKGQTDVILFNFSKAFDKVPHQHLIHKLDFYSGRHIWISSFLGDRSQQMLLDGATSSSASVQGSKGQCARPSACPPVYKWPDRVHITAFDSQIICRWLVLYRTIETEFDVRDHQHDLDRLQQ